MRRAERGAADGAGAEDPATPGPRRGWMALFILPPLLIGLLPRGPEIVAGPLLQEADADGITVVWETSEPATTELVWGRSLDDAQRTVVEGRRTLHRVRLDGLLRDRPLRYRVVSRDEIGRVASSEDASLQPAPPPGDPLVFAVVGDTQDNAPVWRRLARAIRAERPSLLVHCGDLVEDGDDRGDTRAGASSLGDQDLRQLAELYHRRGVDVVFYGHVHGYERTWRLDGRGRPCEDGVLYVQTGGGGGRLEGVAPARSWFTAKVRPVHHYVSVALTPRRLELRAHDLEGRLFDTTTLEKAAAGPGFETAK